MPKEKAKHRHYKSKCKKYLKKISSLEQANRELQFKLTFYEQNASANKDAERLKADKRRVLRK